MDLTSPNLYYNRELSWLEFNLRVLEEAQDKTNPILERLKFLAITASNLDEFFMVRVSGLMEQRAAKFQGRDPSGLTAKQQLVQISEKVHMITVMQYNCLIRAILPNLSHEGIRILKYADLNSEQKEFVEDYYMTFVYPIITPMAIDQSRPVPLLNNRSLNFIVSLKGEEGSEEPLYAFMQIPTVIRRILPLSTEGEFIFLEEIIRQYIHTLFTGYTVTEKALFRITRNSDLSVDEEDADDLLLEIEKGIKKRKWGEPVRLEIEKKMKKASRKYLQELLKLNEADIYEISGPLDLTTWFDIASLEGWEHLRDERLKPQPVPEFYYRDIFDRIRESDVLVHHPYQEFDSVLRFVSQAASDPKVLAIKQTLYRVSGNSPVVNALITAAENGKQVTVLVELKARFDEENNILWAKRLEKSGCHVIYGLVGLKTHCKICLVVRKEDDGIRRYIHLGTGNYNDSTAKLYTDLGFFTCKETFGADVSALFNLLTGYAKNQSFSKLLVAPTDLRKSFIKMINREAENAVNGKPSGITAKLNSLVDVEIIRALYRAASSGVRIKLIVRGICCLKTGVAGVSENISVYSIVDRFLEHSRIYYFENGGNPKIYLSSADWMPRNLERRVEVAFPVEDSRLKEKLTEILDITLSDTVKLRIQMPDGSYEKIDRRGKELIHSQLKFHSMAVDAYKAALDSEIGEPRL